MAAQPNLFQLSMKVLHDLPIEMLECILVRAVAMEVKNMKLAKSVWKEKADLVISRLRTVCSHWCDILTTDHFRTKLHRILDGTAQDNLRLEMIQRTPVPYIVLYMTALKDEIYMLCLENEFCHVMNVYDRNNMAEVKDIISLPDVMNPWGIGSCSSSDTVFVLKEDSQLFSLMLIHKANEHQFNTSKPIAGLNLINPHLIISGDGRPIIVSGTDKASVYMLSFYNADYTLRNTIMLDWTRFELRWLERVLQTQSGNLVFFTFVGIQSQVKLFEVDPMTGRVIRQYLSSLNTLKAEMEISIMDSHGRLLISDGPGNSEVLDVEMNLIDRDGPEVSDDRFIYPSIIHYNSRRNELLRLPFSYFTEDDRRILSIYRFI